MINQYVNKKDTKKYYEIKNHYIGKDIFTGKEKRISKKGFRTKREAEQYIIKAKSEFLNGGFKPNQDYTFQDVYDVWVKEYEPQVKQTTFNMMNVHIKNIVLPYFGNFKVNQINLPICQKFINELSKKYKKGTIREYKTKASMILDYAVKMDVIKVNYLKYTKVPNKQEIKKDNFYTKPELIEFLQIVKNNYDFKDFVMFRLLAFTGLRRGELIALTWKDINFKNKTLTVNKNAVKINKKIVISDTKTQTSNRIIYIDDETLDILKEYRSQNKVFEVEKNIFNLKNLEYFTWKLKCIFNNFPKLKKINIHGFRHTHATLLFESGVTAKDVQIRLGHANITTTLNTYTHITEDKKKDVTKQLSKFMTM